MYAYQAEVWCDRCGRAIKDRILKTAPDPGVFETEDEEIRDSEEWPQWADECEATDGPQHCGAGAECLSAEVLGDGSKVGALLGSNLTREGWDYLVEMISEPPRTRYNRALHRFWIEAFDVRFRVTMYAYCGMADPIVWGASLDECRATIAEYIRKARKAGRIVNLLERGRRWEVQEPEGCVMVPDDAGIIGIDREARR